MVSATFAFSKKKLLGALLALLPGAGLCQADVWAQGPVVVSQQTAESRIRVKSRTFSFPLRFDVAGNSGVHEVCLFMKEGTGEWVCVKSVPPTATSIPCLVPHDGEFGFIVVTRDGNGQLCPANLSQLTPTMMVVVEAPRTPGLTPTQYPIVSDQPPGLPPPNLIAPPSSVPLSTPEVVVPPGPLEIPVASVPHVRETTSVVSAIAPTRNVVNTTHVGIDYNVGRVGPSGVGKIEVWATQDQGRTWQKVGEDREHRSPAVADLPGEGVYGIRLVATNGNGFGGKTPSAGDQPVTTIEVDLTSPVISSLTVDPVAKNGSLEIRWKVTDKNLHPEGINLYYATARTGPWQPIASKVKNDEVYRWTLPANVPQQLYFRLEASDLAGNVSHNDTQNPIMLDMTEPDVNVIGVVPIQGRIP